MNVKNISKRDRQWVVFKLGKEHFACPVAEVREIVTYQAPVPVPGSPSQVEGILNVRGDIVPVLSGARFVGIEPQSSERIIIVDRDDGLLGMSVDAVGEIIPVEDGQVDTTSASDAVKGTVMHDEQLIVLLEIPLAA